jgi:hypothetical protein
MGVYCVQSHALIIPWTIFSIERRTSESAGSPCPSFESLTKSISLLIGEISRQSHHYQSLPKKKYKSYTTAAEAIGAIASEERTFTLNGLS